MLRKQNLEKITDQLWEIPTSYRGDMRVPARVYASESMLDAILGDRSLEQLVNVATLPGIQKHAVVMPDVHEGYGFPIGGVAAFDPDEGVISPGGIGYDINCGVRMLKSGRSLAELKDTLPKLAHSMAREVPSGVGRGGKVKVRGADLDAVLEQGAARVANSEDDLPNLESRGMISGADARLVSPQAKERGQDQLGTMGAGNHFVEIDVVDRIFDAGEAERLGLFEGQLVVLIHTGSRGLGHQIATDFLKTMARAMATHNIKVADRELACAPFRSSEGQRYFAAMAAGANFAFANRQMIAEEVRRAWSHELGDSEGKLTTVYDVAHNVAKIETHGGKEVVMHRKGATRAFPGQPVIIPGSMGTASYVLVGRPGSMEQSFGSTCHGAGRTMSRSRAKKEIKGEELKARLKRLGIVVEGGSLAGLVEEAPEAYKDVDEVVGVVDRAGIASRVARLRPVAVVKG
jgi:tRNA-splicing ligase RtcB